MKIKYLFIFILTICFFLFLISLFKSCKKNVDNIPLLVGMDISIDPKKLTDNSPLPEKYRIDLCNTILQKQLELHQVKNFDKSSNFSNKNYFCYGDKKDMLIDSTSNYVCYGKAAIVPDNYNGKNYLGSCSNPILSDPQIGKGVKNYLCKDSNVNLPISQTSCGGDNKKNAKPCIIDGTLNLPPNIGICS